jgi:4-hydroxythreonine-4-phosphate dehydrogenase
MKNKPIILVAGEPRSVFLEIFFKALKKNKFKSPLILICCKEKLINEMKIFNFKKKIKILKLNDLKKKLNNDKINLLNVCLINNTSNKLNCNDVNTYIYNSFNLAFQIIKNNFANKLINGPIKKSFFKKKYLGVTEYLSDMFKQKKIGMLIYNKKLSVCPATTHLPLKLVSKNITKKLIEQKIELINEFYCSILKIKPRIAVAGLNPHCESILDSNEDEQIIKLAVKSQAKKRINVKGPFPADSLFLKKNRKQFDVILGMYHDQVLTPLKTIFEYDAINITMGLPFIRISPDHGPNESMMGKNLSNPESLIKAISFLDRR